MRLLVFAGLPGSGKTQLARRVAQRTGSTFLRVDTIESAIATMLAPIESNPVGYVAAEWVAQEQLDSGRDVVIDAVNDVEIARQGWIDLARRTGRSCTSSRCGAVIRSSTAAAWRTASPTGPDRARRPGTRSGSVNGSRSPCPGCWSTTSAIPSRTLRGSCSS